MSYKEEVEREANKIILFKDIELLKNHIETGSYAAALEEIKSMEFKIRRRMYVGEEGEKK